MNTCRSVPTIDTPTSDVFGGGLVSLGTSAIAFASSAGLARVRSNRACSTVAVTNRCGGGVPFAPPSPPRRPRRGPQRLPGGGGGGAGGGAPPPEGGKTTRPRPEGPNQEPRHEHSEETVDDRPATHQGTSRPAGGAAVDGGDGV